MITLLPHNSAWLAAFELEKKQLLQLNIKNIIQVEHIGSTAISGIHAKPVIDILIGVKCLHEFTSEDIQKIESLDYRYNQVFESVFPHRRYFQKTMNMVSERTRFIWLIFHLLGMRSICCFAIICVFIPILLTNMKNLSST